jgi:hypothetical protein
MNRYLSFVYFLIALVLTPSAFALDLDKLENVTVRVITNENELTQRSPNILSFPQQFVNAAPPATAQLQPTNTQPPTISTNMMQAKPLALPNQK